MIHIHNYTKWIDVDECQVRHCETCNKRQQRFVPWKFKRINNFESAFIKWYLSGMLYYTGKKLKRYESRLILWNIPNEVKHD